METSGRKPKKLWVDDGVAYWGKAFAGPAKRAGIELYSTQGDGKSVLAERVIQTITSWLWEEMTAKGTEDWVSLLPGTVARYNNTKHRSLGMTPADASDPENAEAAFDTQYGPPQAVERPLLKVGDWVRLARLKGTFEKGRNERWTTELYRVVEVNNRAPPVMYKVADGLGDVLKGRFYVAMLKRSNFSSESQRELLFPRMDPAAVGPDKVARVLGYRMSPTNKSKYGQYLITVELGDGSKEEVPLQAYIGRVDKQACSRPPRTTQITVDSPNGPLSTTSLSASLLCLCSHERFDGIATCACGRSAPSWSWLDIKSGWRASSESP
jgi:hypothetical protein